MKGFDFSKKDDIRYISTRGHSGAVTSAQAIKRGLAPDGGLYMPERLPRFTRDDLTALRGMGYPERAAAVLSRFLTDYAYDDLLSDCRAAYSPERFPGGAAPLRRLCDGVSMLELWHGPTSAFKDMALQIMPRLLSRALAMTGEQRTAHILVATSGDTGKAALEGYRDADGIRITVFYPQSGVSRIQKLQMATQEGANVAVHAVVGNFDDTQNGVKRLFSDTALAGELDGRGYFFSSANSINWGRLAPQVVYYISAYCDMVSSGAVADGEEIDICVPTGNFGNIFAACLARRCGLPVRRLVCASNQNRVLTDFFRSGVYDRRREFFTTASPSMDILISSNLERLLYLTAGAEKTAAFMKALSEEGDYSVGDELRAVLAGEFSAYCADEEQCAARIAAAWNEYGYLIDPHTAVGLDCAARFMTEEGDGTPMLVVSTASPFKFAPAVLPSVGGAPTGDDFEDLDLLSSLSGVPVPAPLAALRKKPVRFDPAVSVDPAAMADAVRADER